MLEFPGYFERPDEFGSQLPSVVLWKAEVLRGEVY
jgi:hypothetical protein